MRSNKLSTCAPKWYPEVCIPALHRLGHVSASVHLKHVHVNACGISLGRCSTTIVPLMTWLVNNAHRI
jgi:hypothetical protein